MDGEEEQGITAPQLGQPDEVVKVIEEDGSLSNQFLNNVPEEDRRIVEKYIKDWDAGVTKKFQSYADQLKEYTEFGDPQQIQTAMILLQELSENPVEFVSRTQEYINENPDLFKEFMQMDEEEQNEVIEAVGQEDDFTAQQLADLQQQIAEMKEEQTTTEQMKMLDAAIEEWHDEHGSFNEEYVLLKISQGMEPEDAIASWNETVSEFIDSRKGPSAPKLLPGQGGTPLDQVDKAKLRDPAFRKEYGAELLKAQLGR